MSTFNVSNSRELDSALDSARGGDRIVLDQGNYNALNINGRNTSDGITITSGNAGRPAVFDELDLRNVSNITLDGLKFDDDGGGGGKAFYIYGSDGVTIRDTSFEGVVRNGYAANFGLQVQTSEDITVEGSEFSDFTKAASFINVKNLDVRNNDFYRSSVDSMAFGDVHNVDIVGNEVHGHKPHGSTKHTDVIQFWAETRGGASSDVTIRNNVLRSGGDDETHGIFMGNGIAGRTGSRSDFYKDIVIEDNTIVSGQYHGLSVGHTDGLTIRNNEVLQDRDAPDRAVTTPRIVVVSEAVDVRITGNTAHLISDDGGRSWGVSGNKIVRLGHLASEQRGGNDDDDDEDDGDDDGRVDGPAGPARSGGDGEAEDFRFRGGDVRGRETDRLSGVDFGEDDEIVFTSYDRNTFEDFSGGNLVSNNRTGTYVKIDSLADIRELDRASDDVGVRVRGDTLVLTIDQEDGTHQVSMAGLGDSYDALF